MKNSEELDSLTYRAGYTQLIDKPTDAFSRESSCIEKIFCNKPEIVGECGIDHYLFQKCHHNIIFAKISANMSLTRSYSRELWNYQNANVERIQKFS